MDWITRLFSVAFALGFIGAHALAQDRVALIIANSQYEQVPRLANPLNDAKLVAASLKKVGFGDVPVLMDLSKGAMEKALRDFGMKAQGANIALVYYAGHGIEVGGVNYLIPVEAKLSDADFVELEAVPANLAQQMAKRAKGVNIVVLDACRDNPFVPKMRSVGGGRSVGTRGLAAVEAGGVSVLALAAKAGSVAQDGEGTNGPYAAALAKHIATPGIELRLMFGRVRDEVMTLTKGKQEPFIYESLGGKEYFLAEGPRPQAGGASAPAPVARTLSPDDWRKRIQELTPGTPTERYTELFGTARHIEFPGTVAGVANVEYRVYAAGPFEVYHVLSGRKPVGLGLRTMPGTQEKGPYWPKDGDFQSMDEATPDRTSNSPLGCTGELKFGGERAAVFVLTPPCQFGAYPGGVTTQAFAYAYVDSDANASCDTEVQALFGQQKAPKLCKSMSSWAPVAMFVDWDLNAQAGLDMLVKKMMRER